ncbi:type VI secretion system lipoprotein TssJ [Chitinibacteraceae bacterium HSL-7]
MTRAKALFFCAFVLTLSACTSTKPVDVQLKTASEAGLNQDARGRSLSVVLRVYQLTDGEAFKKLTFEDISTGKTDEALLGSSLISRSEVILLPGQPVPAPENIKANTKFVGLVGVFRQPDAHFWRYLIDAKQIRKKDGLELKARDCALELISPVYEPIPGQPAFFSPSCQIVTPATPAKTKSKK